ncbi:MAG: amidohydrolase [Actinomycetota bacterium]|nr:amidohydrolase [Actinomycetota bacterium]
MSGGAVIARGAEVVQLQEADRVKESDLSLIDCDVHPHLRRGMEDLAPYLSAALRHRIGIGEQPARSRNSYRDPVSIPRNLLYFNPAGVLRRDAIPPDGSVPSSDSAYVASHLLDAHHIARAILIGGDVLGLGAMPDPDLAAAIASAYNEWLAEHWLAIDERYRAALVAPPQDPAQAAKEIRRMGAREGFVAVLVPLTNILMGQRHYYPIYEAAEELGLPVTIHPNSGEGIFTTSPSLAGAPPTYYVEWHTGLSQVFQANLISLVCHGVFERFPTLKVVITEGGFAWLPDVLWRLDKNVKGLRDDVPWIRRLPSEYVFEHVRFTTQPFVEPKRAEHLHALCDIVHADKTLMFSSDYPHWDFDDPVTALNWLPKETRQRVRADNAVATYGERLVGSGSSLHTTQPTP